MIDYHIHSTHSGDGESSVFEMCERAVALGISEIGFTDHLDFTPTDDCYGCFNFDAFMRDIDKARIEYGSDLVIRTGLEVDYQIRYHEQIAQWLEGKSFDYIIGSAHYVDGVILEDHEIYFTGKTQLEAYLPYFDTTEAVIKSGLFNVLAHIDLCKRYGVRYYGEFPFETFYDRLAELLGMVIKAGMVLEVNTSGLRQSPGDTYPSMDIVRLYRDLGGERISIGSDAHRVSDLGAGIRETMERLSVEGINELVVFEERRAVARHVQSFLYPRLNPGAS